MESILIVDDEMHVRELLRTILEGSGYRCELAVDAKEARAQLMTDSFDLILSDIKMPGESGVDLARYIKLAYPDTAVIIVSSIDDPLEIKKILNIGVYGYIVKPIERSYVFISVNNALQRLKLERAQKEYQHNLERIIENRTKKLASSERRFRNLVEGSIQGIIIHKDLKPVFANRAFLNIHGYSEEELSRVKTILDFIAPEEHPRLQEYKKDRLSGKQAPTRYEYQGIRKDGSRIWLETNVRMVDWNGEQGIQLIVSDITERKQNETLLKDSETRLKSILDAILTGVLVIDEETHTIVDANHYATQLIGAPKNKIVGRMCHRFACPTERGNCPVTDLGQDVDQSERQLLTTAGDTIPILKTVKRFQLDGRDHLIESFVDISQLKKMEAQQKEQFHFLSALVNDIPYPLYFKNNRGVYKLWNNAYENFRGIKSKEVIGKTCYQVWPKDIAQKIEKQDNALFQNPQIQNYDIQLPDHQGNLRDMEITEAIYIKQNGDIGGLIGLMKDVTDKRQLEAQLHQAQKLESIGQLAAGIAHEINTPTQYVRDNIRFLEDAFVDLKTVLRSYGKMLEAVKHETRYQLLVKEVESILESADMEYLEEEIPVAIEQSIEGVEQVAKIVRSMKEFSHPGVGEKVLINLNKAIESTITIARNEWKYVAEMETHFDPDIPLVSGLPWDLNKGWRKLQPGVRLQ